MHFRDIDLRVVKAALNTYISDYEGVSDHTGGVAASKKLVKRIEQEQKERADLKEAMKRASLTAP